MNFYMTDICMTFLSISIDNEVSTNNSNRTKKKLIWIVIFKSSKILLFDIRPSSTGSGSFLDS